MGSTITMLGRRNFLTAWMASILLAVLLSAGAPSQALAGEFDDGARKFVEKLTQDAISTLAGKDINKAERANRFRALMNKNFAVKGIAKFVLGRHWRKASDGEKEEYLQLFEDLLVATYADRFAKYSGEKLLIEQAQMRGKKDVIVNSTMISVDSSKRLKVAWRVRFKKGSYKVIDIMVEGISMIMTQKSEFASFIKQNGGSLEALLGELKKRIQANS